MKIPKEYFLETPANYDEFKFRNHLTAVLTLTSFAVLKNCVLTDNPFAHSLFASFFKTKEHKQLAYDLLQYVMDTEDTTDSNIIKQRLIIAMHQSGYFGA